jgi:hypothetical protein
MTCLPFYALPVDHRRKLRSTNPLEHLTLVGAPVARAIDRFGIWLSTFGQEPPGKDKLEARSAGAEQKKPFAERVREHAPPGILVRRGRRVQLAFRVLWFLLVGWWLGAL